MADPIIIIGGGISGLALALSLHGPGVRSPRTFESSAAQSSRLASVSTCSRTAFANSPSSGLFPALRLHSVEPARG